MKKPKDDSEQQDPGNSELQEFESLVAAKVAAGLHPEMAAEVAKRQLENDAKNAQ